MTESFAIPLLIVGKDAEHNPPYQMPIKKEVVCTHHLVLKCYIADELAPKESIEKYRYELVIEYFDPNDKEGWRFSTSTRISKQAAKMFAQSYSDGSDRSTSLQALLDD